MTSLVKLPFLFGPFLVFAEYYRSPIRTLFFPTLPVPAAAPSVKLASLPPGCNDSLVSPLYVFDCKCGTVSISSEICDKAERPHAIASGCCNSCAYMEHLFLAPPLCHVCIRHYSVAAYLLALFSPSQCLPSVPRMPRYLCFTPAFPTFPAHQLVLHLVHHRVDRSAGHESFSLGF